MKEEEIKPVTTKDIILSLLAIVVLLTGAYISFECMKIEPPVKTIKYDYYLEMNQDSIYIITKQGDTIHSEKYNDVNPTPLQQSLNKDNL